MQGNPAVLDRLIGYVRIELTGHKQYMLHAAHCHRWGYERLSAKQAAYSQEESEHAARLLRRILLLGGAPDVSDVGPVTAEDTVPAQLRRDHELVSRAITHLQEAIAICRDERDDGSRALFTEMLCDEENHLEWLETELRLIDELGLPLYLQRSTG